MNKKEGVMRVNELFYSLQGEGRFTGVPAVFVRFSGCNLKCSFCDTDHSAYREMTEDDIIESVCRYPSRHIVLTGGEPAMQVTTTLVEKLHRCGFFVQMETNGTVALPEGCRIDWITCSPKYKSVALKHVDELKVVYEGNDAAIDKYSAVEAKEFRLQPCDEKNEMRNAANLKGAVDYCLRHPQWHLSLQTHKIINVR